MEINVNFVLLEALQDKPDDNGAVARIVVVRESKDANLALEDGAAGLFPLE
ncbi:MAG TPA: hypothetical protein VE263_19520 [Candidatus Angelobacter sp.]|nr:hypothetical protein [Candidatus Angelobacter sp.]